MPRKTKIIFLTVFVIVGAIMLYVYFVTQSNNSNTNGSGSSTSGYKSFNPFSNNGGSTTPTPSSTTPSNTPTDNQEVSVAPGSTALVGGVQVFHQLTTSPVAGAQYFEDTRPIVQQEGTTPPPTTTKKTKTPATPAVETVPAVRYVDQMTGHIYEIYLDDLSTTNEVSNSTVPSIYQAIFNGNASTVIYRYLGDDNQTITSYMATLGAPKGEFLPSNITDLSVSTDKSKFFYLIEDNNGVTGMVRSFTDIKKSQVFSSPFTEWLSQWVGPQKIYLTTKASSTVDGYLFALNTATGTLSKVLGGIQGLTTLANSTGVKIAYSNTQTGQPLLSVVDLGKETTTSTNLYTLPEKCVWAGDNITLYCAIPDTVNTAQYPDDWYQGKISFTDQFVKINTDTGVSTVVADSANQTAVDGTQLFLNKDGSDLFFINKKDGTLWELDLNSQQ